MVTQSLHGAAAAAAAVVAGVSSVCRGGGWGGVGATRMKKKIWKNKIIDNMDGEKTRIYRQAGCMFP